MPSKMNLSANGFVAANVNESNIRWMSLIFDCSLGASNTRSKDSLALYPVWSVGVALDKWYGQLYGIQVDIWADTGQVRVVQEAWSTLPPPDEISTANERIGTPISATSNATQLGSIMDNLRSPMAAQANSQLLFGVFFTATCITCVFLCFRVKNKLSKTKIIQQCSRKRGLMLIVFLLLAMLLLSSFTFVGATLQRGAGAVWGSESTGAYDPNFPPNYNWRKSMTEIGLQQQIADNITWNDLANAGYDAYNWQGGGTVKSNFLYYLSSLQNSHDPIIAVDFDHGVGRNDYSQAYGEFHFMVEDDIGIGYGSNQNKQWNPENGIYDMDIYSRVNDGQVLLAFINTCNSANLYYSGQSWQGSGIYGARGMPYAWMHRIIGVDMSSEGYGSPDNSHQVYIGFPGGSASLSQTVPTGAGSGPQYYRWVQNFFYYATHYDISVHEALDWASWTFFNTYFGASPLNTGFNSCWWNMQNSTNYPDKMAVYGNSNVHLLLHTLTVNAYDSNSNPVNENVYIDGYLRGTTGNSFAVDSGSHTLQVGTASNCFHYFNGYSDLSNPVTVSVTQDTMITANYYANPPPQYTLTVSTTDGGTTVYPYTPGNYQIAPALVTVAEQPYTNYLFLYWLLDGNPFYGTSITIPMSSNHNVEAVFAPNPPYTYVSSIDSYAGAVSNPEDLAGWQNDGQFAEIDGYGPYQYYGWITAFMNAPSSGEIYIYGCGNGPLYVYASTDDYSWYLVSVTYVTSSSPYWIDCGSCTNTFNHIAVTAEDPNYFYYIELDSVQVQP